MKYSLRSLMIGLTLFCVLLGGRIEYLRRSAIFHDEEADRCAARLHDLIRNPGSDEFDSCRKEMDFHVKMARQFRSASPWTLVRENPPPKHTPAETKPSKGGDGIMISGSS